MSVLLMVMWGKAFDMTYDTNQEARMTYDIKQDLKRKEGDNCSLKLYKKQFSDLSKNMFHNLQSIKNIFRQQDTN